MKANEENSAEAPSQPKSKTGFWATPEGKAHSEQTEALILFAGERASGSGQKLPSWLKEVDGSGSARYNEIHESQTWNPRRAYEALWAGKQRAGLRSGATDGDRAASVQLGEMVARGETRRFAFNAFKRAQESLRNVGRTEHSVFHEEGSDRVYKVTRFGRYGHGSNLSDYFLRLADSNSLFKDDYRVEGAIQDPETKLWGLVISQPWVQDARPASPKEIAETFEGIGFSRISGTSYFNPTLGLLVYDASPENVLFGEKTQVVYPIDVGVERLTGEKLEDMKREYGDNTLHAGDRAQPDDEIAELFAELNRQLPSQEEVEQLRALAHSEPIGERTVGRPDKANYAGASNAGGCKRGAGTPRRCAGKGNRPAMGGCSVGQDQRRPSRREENLAR